MLPERQYVPLEFDKQCTDFAVLINLSPGVSYSFLAERERSGIEGAVHKTVKNRSFCRNIKLSKCFLFVYEIKNTDAGCCHNVIHSTDRTTLPWQVLFTRKERKENANLELGDVSNLNC